MSPAGNFGAAFFSSTSTKMVTLTPSQILQSVNSSTAPHKITNANKLGASANPSLFALPGEMSASQLYLGRIREIAA